VLAWVVPVLGLVGTFFALLLVFVASPFATQVAPADGAGLNPSLQNPYMAIHPPMLYLGYVGLTVPFAFAMGALLARRTDERWIVATRRWTLAAWAFLGIGQLLGAHWAYVEIGWGGYYAWDPVENAALMPWLAATRSCTR
jgi:cytochrome c-type biogenesis protein CcmF